jgi:hypothetical protein
MHNSNRRAPVKQWGEHPRGITLGGASPKLEVFGRLSTRPEPPQTQHSTSHPAATNIFSIVAMPSLSVAMQCIAVHCNFNALPAGCFAERKSLEINSLPNRIIFYAFGGVLADNQGCPSIS